MATSRRFEIAELFPQPKKIELGEGISELALDVRLATTNVSPVQRKALRSILTMVGVRVVANKKKYVVDARVLNVEDNPEAFHLEDVPPACQKDYYELRIQGSEVFITSPHQEGMVWAAQTLASLFSMMIHGLAVPNLFIRDWPVLPVRGILADCDWTSDRMALVDWQQAIDALSAVKLNVLGLGIYDSFAGNRLTRSDSQPEFLMTPISTPAASTDPRTPFHYRYYNVKHDRWYDKTECPPMFAEDFLAELIAHGRERGVAVFPAFNLLGRGFQFANLISGGAFQGKSAAPCLPSAAFRNAVTGFLGAFLDKYYPDGVEYFHIGALDADAPRCACAKCKGKPAAQLAADFIQFLARFLFGKGVQKVVLAADGLLDTTKAFAAMLKKDKELASRLVIQWNDLPKTLAKDIAQFKGADAWLAPAGCLRNHCNFTERRGEIDAAMAQAIKLQTAGVVARSAYDPAFQNHYALVGVRAWETPNWVDDTTDSLQERWADLQWAAYARELIEAREKLQAASNAPAYLAILPDTYLNSSGGTPKAYPAEALAQLAKRPKAAAELKLAHAQAAEAAACFSKMLAKVKWTPAQVLALQSLLASAQRVLVQTDIFLFLQPLKADLAKQKPSAKHAELVAETIRRFVANLKVIEDNAPDWLLWANMQNLGCHKLFLEQLQGQLAKKTAAAKIRWELPNDWEAPEDR